MDDLGKLRKALADIAADAGTFDIVEALADIWVETARVHVPKDTWQTHDRTKVKSVAGNGRNASAEVEADTPYAGFVEYGTRYQRPQPFFRRGRDQAVAELDRVGVKLETQIRRALTSGGVWNPRAAGYTRR